MEFVSRGELPPRFDEPPLTNEAWELIRTCWARQTAVRPEMKDVTRRMKLNLTMQRNSDRRPLLSLLSILRERQVRRFNKVFIRCTYKLVAHVADICPRPNVHQPSLQLVIQGRL